MRIAIATIAVFAAASAAFAHDVDPTKLPLGDGKLSSGPKAGYIWACHTDPGRGGARHAGAWLDEAAGTFDLTKKTVVEGAVTWPHSFRIAIQGDTRVIAWNDLPDHPTGIFPIQPGDPAYRYDTNPNSISAQDMRIALPLAPQLAAEPTCAPNAVGVLLSGVVLFNALDAGGRDAVAHETQDACQGHPRQFGVYHYHDASPCVLKELDSGSGPSQLIGYAVDGFGIYGPRDENGRTLSSADLDACHGRTSEVTWDGKKVVMYHYVATLDFPYTIGCLKGSWSRDTVRTISGPPPRKMGRGPGGFRQGNGVLAGAGGGPGFQSLPGTGRGDRPQAGGWGGRPDLTVAAHRLGISVVTLRRALGPPPPNLRISAARLGISVAELRSALGVR